MRIVCDNCGAKYQISDEKVRNKVFKIRCKKCSHVIIVRAKEEEAAPAAEEEATRVADYPSPEATPPVDAIWYVVLNREQQGPFTKGQIEDYFNSGQIDADAFTWCEGMSDWMRLAVIPEFAALVPASAPAMVATATASAATAAAPVAQEALQPEGSIDMGGFPGLDADQDVIASNNSTESESLFGADNPEHGSPRITDGNQLRGQRNENSVLFSLDSLAAEVDARSNRGSVSNTGGAEGSGLIDISALAGGGPSAPSSSFGGDGGFAPVSAAPIAPMGMSPLVQPKGNSTGKIVAIVLGVLLLIGGAVTATIMLTKKDDPKPEVAVNVQKAGTATESVKIGSSKAEAVKADMPAKKADKPAEKTDEPVEKADGSAEKTKDEPKATDKPVAKVAAKSGTSRRSKKTRRSTRNSAEDKPPARAAPVAKPAAKKKSGKKNDEVDDLLGALAGGNSRKAAPAGKSKPSAPEGNPLLPERLSKSQILGVVRRNSGPIRGCKSKDPSGAGGTVMVRMTIGGNGRIKSAKSSGKFGGTSLGQCVEGKVRRFKFPQFSGAPMSINMPFRI